jgi:hypothetical protein
MCSAQRLRSNPPTPSPRWCVGRSLHPMTTPNVSDCLMLRWRSRKCSRPIHSRRTTYSHPHHHLSSSSTRHRTRADAEVDADGEVEIAPQGDANASHTRYSASVPRAHGEDRDLCASFYLPPNASARIHTRTGIGIGGYWLPPHHARTSFPVQIDTRRLTHPS